MHPSRWRENYFHDTLAFLDRGNGAGRFFEAGILLLPCSTFLRL